ncbi:unnamed protein product [Vitrella brassicaformis CCMP3155]|uniref:RING-type domain-containing protein n=1 Tax=Vitrella brassicaformis (strain CCMP3155) TaxID=1169540 RepID=A0A0G4FW17_VITBC|nr:unnamed protein product [Vitrella brassicaformis CCMP3155]|eukprot:CEM19298.1 unnamed protein product [Vitrella brassicaformis CCMP3155]
MARHNKRSQKKNDGGEKDVDETNRLMEERVFPLMLDQERLKCRQQPCGVCLLDFEEGDVVRGSTTSRRDFRLGLIDTCPHAFHYKCIETWASQENSCPQCKKRFIAMACYTNTGRRQSWRFVDEAHLVDTLSDSDDESDAGDSDFLDSESELFREPGHSPSDLSEARDQDEADEPPPLRRNRRARAEPSAPAPAPAAAAAAGPPAQRGRPARRGRGRSADGPGRGRRRAREDSHEEGQGDGEAADKEREERRKKRKAEEVKREPVDERMAAKIRARIERQLARMPFYSVSGPMVSRPAAAAASGGGQAAAAGASAAAAAAGASDTDPSHPQYKMDMDADDDETDDKPARRPPAVSSNHGPLPFMQTAEGAGDAPRPALTAEGGDEKAPNRVLKLAVDDGKAATGGRGGGARRGAVRVRVGQFARGRAFGGFSGFDLKPDYSSDFLLGGKKDQDEKGEEEEE